MGAPRYGNRVSSEKSKKRYFIVNFLLYKHNDYDIFDNFPTVFERMGAPSICWST